jgi:hypothetical protein
MTTARETERRMVEEYRDRQRKVEPRFTRHDVDVLRRVYEDIADRDALLDADRQSDAPALRTIMERVEALVAGEDA